MAKRTHDTHDINGNPRLKRPEERTHPLKPKIILPEKGKFAFLGVFALLLVVAWMRPWDMVGETGREQLLQRSRNMALNGTAVEQAQLVERIDQESLEVELWKVTAAGQDYYQVAAWEKALGDLWYAVEVADNGSWGYGWTSVEELEQRSDSYTFAFKHGMGSYSGTVSVDGEMTFGQGSPEHQKNS